MKIEELEIPMPDEYKELLLSIVLESKKQKTLQGIYICLDQGLSFVGIGNSRVMNDSIQGNPFLSYSALGMIQTQGARDNVFVLMPFAFKWYDYQKKKGITKFLLKVMDKARDIIIAISFVLSMALTIVSILGLIK